MKTKKQSLQKKLWIYNFDQTRLEKNIKSREAKNSEDTDQLINLIKGN